MTVTVQTRDPDLICGSYIGHFEFLAITWSEGLTCNAVDALTFSVDGLCVGA